MPDVDIEPVRIDPTAEPEKIDHIPVFYIGEQEYTAPKKVSAQQALRASRIMLGRGTTAAMAWLVQDALGDKAVSDLITCPSVTGDQVKKIMSSLQELYFGQMEEMTGN